MSAGFDAKVLAGKLLAVRRGAEPLMLDAAGPLPGTFDDALAVQRVVMADLGAAGGFKTANVAAGEPVPMAPIPVSNVRLSPAHYDGSEMRRVGIELEIAFRIDRPLPSPEAADFEMQLRAAVSVLPAIEMVDTRLADVENAPPLLKLADMQSGFGLVAGEPVADWASLNVENPAIAFTVDGRQIGTTAGQVPGGNAFAALAGFVRAAGNHCGGLQVGQYVTTGSLSGLHWITHGCEVAGRIEGIGDVSVSIGHSGG